MEPVRVAVVQMASGPKVPANLDEAARLLADAAARGAKLAVLPENFALMGRSIKENLEIREQPGSGPIQDFLAQQAQQNGMWLVGGTIPMQTETPDKVRAACILFDDNGAQVRRYDKIHLFDVLVNGDSQERYAESETIDAGGELAVVDTPFGRLGLAVCYDLRFPELFRAMVVEGTEIIALPSAFTAVTGRAHWETLIRARAVENLCYVLAADQGGFHVSGRETYGDSMVVDPWGTILDRLPKGPGVIVQDIELERVHQLRRSFPAIDHIRLTCEPR